MPKIKLYELGTEEFPIPIIDKVTGNVIWASSEEDKITIPSMRDETPEEFYGFFIRNVVPDPVMMKDMTEVLMRLDKTRTPKDSKSYAYTVMGAPGTGKTFITQALSELVHPRGAIMVDCNNIENPDELYKVTTFSVDQTRKQRVINAYIKEKQKKGEEISPQTVLYLKQMFGNKNITQETRDGKKILAIDWNGIQEESAFIEKVCDEVMKLENIKYDKDSSALGFVVSNGPLLRALADPLSPDYGRPIIRDENNRAPKVDAWLQIEAFFSEPGRKQLRLKGEDNREFIIDRQEIPEIFNFLSTANDATEENGESAKDLTNPMISRAGMGIDIRLLSDARLQDYISRTLKHLTGVPTYHVYMEAREHFDKHPEELSEELMRMRTIGLSKEELKKIPEEEKFNIKHIDRTIKAAIYFASIVQSAEELINEASKDATLPSEYLNYLNGKAIVDLRYIFKLLQHSKISYPKGEKKGVSVFSRTKTPKKHKTQEELQAEVAKKIAARSKNQLFVRGIMLENEIVTKLHEILIPDTIDAMLKKSEDKSGDMEKIEGYWKTLTQVAKSHHFEFAGYVGEDSFANIYNAKKEDFPDVAIEEVKNTLIESMKKEYGDDLTPEGVFDDETLDEAVKMLAQTPEGSFIFVPNLDIATTMEEPFHMLEIKETQPNKQETNREELLTTKDFINSVMLAQLREHNMKKMIKESASSPYVKQICEDNSVSDNISDIVLGQHEQFFTTQVIINNEEENKLGTAHIIYNKSSKGMLILADFEVSAEDRKKMKDKGVLFANTNELIKSDKFQLLDDYIDNQVVDTTIKQDLASALILRIEPSFVDVTVGDDLVDFFKYIAEPSEDTGNDAVAISLTKKDYKPQLELNAMKDKGR
ncbi:MAG: hypothetical protein IJZ30_07165 [Alphaproteobacteria bacterium]|nr:hypothetical protein [Alphaproteobacteria bacterium]